MIQVEDGHGQLHSNLEWPRNNYVTVIYFMAEECSLEAYRFNYIMEIARWLYM